MPKKFVARQRKHKVLARLKATSDGPRAGAQDLVLPDSNALEIVPEAKSELEAKKTQLRNELGAAGAPISGKKAKRLEKYIENKLKKDENRLLLARLASNKIDTSFLSSSRNLGQGKETKRQWLSRALKEHQAGLRHDDDLFEYRASLAADEIDTQADRAAKDDARITDLPAVQAAIVDVGSLPKSQTPGSGLKRLLELGEDGRPMIQKRQKRGGIKYKFATPRKPLELAEGVLDEEWNGFSSPEIENSSSLQGLDGVSEAETESTSEDWSEDESVDLSRHESEETSETVEGTRERSSAFKAWAHEQRNAALGYEPVDVHASPTNISVPKDFKPRPLDQEPLPVELQSTSNNADRKAFSVSVARTAEIHEARLKLPIVAEEQRIMESIHNHDIVVICGATGSGKTTQVPQFLFEAGYGSPSAPTSGLIGVTQPRKVAAVSMSNRVGQELGDHSDAVAYQIRFEGNVSNKTAIKFMTDGVLLREVSQDIALHKYSSIIVDEAHERSVNTDILVGMLSRVVKLRSELANEDSSVQPLKLIIMSATLRIDDLTKNPILFPTPPPVLNVEGRQFPVTMHFARQTKHDYVEEVYKKICKGHRKLPPGGFLVFLTGYDEISRLSGMLRSAFGGLQIAPLPKARISAHDAPLEVEDIDFGETNNSIDEDEGKFDVVDGEDGEEEDDEEIAEFDVLDEDQAEGGTRPLQMHVLPLYSLLPTREQMRVFDSPPEGSRQVILATNVAETSLTIPGIRFVFDCGRSKERRYDKETGVQSYQIGWISKASANQRAGRAGRTGPGHCYRLYSSAVYERDFAQYADPELLRMPIEGVVLQLKAMKLQHVVNFPFPTPPDRRSVAQAERLLMYLSAITASGQATDIGSTMARFPLPPRFAKILLVGHLHDCMQYTIALVAGLSVAEVFVPESRAIPTLTVDVDQSFRTSEDVAAESRQSQVRQRFNSVHRRFRSLDDASDALKLLQVVGEFAHEPSKEWCEDHFVRFKALQETQKLRRQITSLLHKDVPSFASLTFQEKLDRPSSKQVMALKQMVAAGFIDQVAIRGDLAPTPPVLSRKPRRAIDVPYIPLQRGDAAGTDAEDTLVYIHPGSSLAHFSSQECPKYIVYSHLQRAAPSPDETKKPRTRMIALTDITDAQLAALAKGTPLLSYGKPIREISTEGSLVECLVIPYLRAEGTGGMGWPLTMKKVMHRKVPGRGLVPI